MAATRIAYIQAQWHRDMTDSCRAGFLEEISGRGYSETDIDFFAVPGSLEIPLMAKRLAMSGKYAAVCCSGFVVDGGIYRHEFVANAVLNGIVQASLETGVPILSAVLTPHQFQEHNAAHAEFFTRHLLTKGRELAGACVEMTQSLQALA
jgi:6,7-dimethyl-8-ribityllumazine synthase